MFRGRFVDESAVSPLAALRTSGAESATNAFGFWLLCDLRHSDLAMFLRILTAIAGAGEEVGRTATPVPAT